MAYGLSTAPQCAVAHRGVAGSPNRRHRLICARQRPATGKNPLRWPVRRRGVAVVSANLPNIFNQLGKFCASTLRSLAKSASALQERPPGEMAEWLKAHAWKACVRETVPWVRIPLSPPLCPKMSYRGTETCPKTRPFSCIFSLWRSSAVLKMAREWAWRTRFSPNPRTPDIGTVRQFRGKQSPHRGPVSNLSRSPKAFSNTIG